MHVARQRSTTPPADNPFHRATQIDIDGHGALLDTDLCGLGHHGRITTDELGTHRPGVGRKVEKTHGRVDPSHDRLGSHHLRAHQARTQLAAEVTGRHVGDPHHGRDENGGIERKRPKPQGPWCSGDSHRTDRTGGSFIGSRFDRGTYAVSLRESRSARAARKRAAI